MQRQIVAIAIAAFVVACNSNNFLRLQTKDDVTGKFLPKIVKDFNDTVGCEAWSIESKSINLSKDLKIDRRQVNIFRSSRMVKECNQTAYGCFDPFSNEIMFIEENPSWQNADGSTIFFYISIELILLHELGHAMGLDHEENTVMNETYMYMPYTEAIQSLVDLVNKHKKNQCWQIHKED